MNPSVIFVNSKNRLRSGWRLLVFLFLFMLAAGTIRPLLAQIFGARTFATAWGDALLRLLMLVVATLAGWVCAHALEGVPPRALGWAMHRGWWRDLLLGSAIGVASLLLAVLLAFPFGGYAFALVGSSLLPLALKSLVLAAGFFVIAGAAEEALFRGYPFQTLLRSLPAWVPLLLTAVLFSTVHLDNPNAVPGFTFVNTALAGVWLAVAYLRTRSLWFPLGVHWAWNWALGSLMGLPVSGMTFSRHASLVQTVDRGPAWLTGGAYGVEGGAACAVALILSTVFVWRTRLVKADPELKRLTDEEIPGERPRNPAREESETRATFDAPPRSQAE